MRFFKINKKSGMLLLDLVTSLTIIWFLIWIFGSIIARLSLITREVSLRYQLSNFRMMLSLYKELNGAYPDGLAKLAGANYKLSKTDEFIFSDKFLDNLQTDKQGAVLDSFGNRLYYDSRRGVIGSQTRGYENW
jgi:hypothetical protein